MAKPVGTETLEEIQAEQNAPVQFLKAVKDLPAGTVFSSGTEQIHKALQPLPPQARGAMFHKPEFRKLSKRIGVTVSPYTGGYVGQWERVDHAA